MVENISIYYGYNPKSGLFMFYCMNCNNLLCGIDEDIDVIERQPIIASYEINYCHKCGRKLNWNNLIYRNIENPLI